jgi:hypothetical protein
MLGEAMLPVPEPVVSGVPVVIVSLLVAPLAVVAVVTALLELELVLVGLLSLLLEPHATSTVISRIAIAAKLKALQRIGWNGRVDKIVAPFPVLNDA